MMATRYLLFIVLFSHVNLAFIFAQDAVLPRSPGTKIVIDGKEYIRHVVQSGEGLYRLSLIYGVSQHEILMANSGLTTELKAGQIINVPVKWVGEGINQQPRLTGNIIYHTVEKGQTAFAISRLYNIPVESIYTSNPGTREVLKVGDVLEILLDTAGESVTTGAVNQNDNFIYHTVEQGETLTGIARLHVTTVTTIIDFNPALRTGILGVGSVVRIPKSTAKGVNVSQVTNGGTQGSGFIRHTVLAGQTLYTISKLHQVDINTILIANPAISNGDLKVGEILRIPLIDGRTTNIQAKPGDGTLFVNHVVKRRETLFGIARAYNLDIETLKLVNPALDQRNLRKGDVLRIPTDAWFSSRLAPVDSPKRETGVDTRETPDSFISSDCKVNTTLGHQTPIKVALLFPFSASGSNRLLNPADTTVVSRALPSMATRSKVFTEFYGGMLLALDTLKKQGVSVELTVHDIAADGRALGRVLQDKRLVDADLIIGPALANELPLVSAFSREHAIPLVYPMSNTNPELHDNPFLFHINTPDSLFYNQMADEIIRQSAGSNLIVILPTTSESGASIFARKIKQRANRLNSGGIRYIEYRAGGDDLLNLQGLINKEMDNFIVVPSVSEAEVSKIVPILAGVRELTKARITLFGMPDWLRFQTLNPEEIHLLNGSVFAPFGLDYKNKSTNKFIKKYREWFRTEPHAVSPYFQSSGTTSGFSRFGIWGYDVTNYFVNAIFRYGRDFMNCLDNFDHDEIQFNFDFQRVSNWGGYYNRGLFLIKFNPDFSTERVPVVIR